MEVVEVDRGQEVHGPRGIAKILSRLAIGGIELVAHGLVIRGLP